MLPLLLMLAASTWVRGSRAEAASRYPSKALHVEVGDWDKWLVEQRKGQREGISLTTGDYFAVGREREPLTTPRRRAAFLQRALSLTGRDPELQATLTKLLNGH